MSSRACLSGVHAVCFSYEGLSRVADSARVTPTASMSYIRPELFAFFVDLKANNNREWFQANKRRYEVHVKEPLLGLIAAFTEPLARISTRFTAIPKMGGSLFRIYRDIRFSKDKRPYKTAAGVHFRHEAGKSAHAPGFYLHLEPGEVFAGVGIWGPDSKTLTKIRQAIVDDPDRWEAITQDPAFADHYDLSHPSESLKRAPRGFDPDHPLVEDLKRKHFVGTVRFTEDEASADDFLEQLAQTYQRGAAYMEFLTTAIGLDW